MVHVNYYLLGEIFGLLERIEVIDGVSFSEFDPDDEFDVRQIAEKFVQPSLNRTSRETQESIRASLAYYGETGSAPFQLLRDRCQELSLGDANNWPLFFHRICKTLFGEDALRYIALSECHEVLDEGEAQFIFA